MKEKKVLIFLLVCLIALTPCVSAFSSLYLGSSPDSIHVNLEKDYMITRNIIINSKISQTITASVYSDDQSYDWVYIVDGVDVTKELSFQMKPGEQRTIRIKIATPQDLDLGEYKTVVVVRNNFTDSFSVNELVPIDMDHLKEYASVQKFYVDMILFLDTTVYVIRSGYLQGETIKYSSLLYCFMVIIVIAIFLLILRKVIK